jgi:hypothetical protein
MTSYSVKILRVEEYGYEVEADDLEGARVAAQGCLHEPMMGDAYPNAINGSITLAAAVTGISSE